MEHQELIPHLFRSEFSKITAVLCKSMGIDQLAAAEDIASDTFVAAFEYWAYSGIPANPTAWLYTAAKNKARNHLQRKAVFRTKISNHLQAAAIQLVEPDFDLSEENIADSQLQMLFAICHPAISIEAQSALALRVLCGFGIEEIADAFITNKETINKRLFRAREKLRQDNVPMAMPPNSAIIKRLDAVLTTLYLLFNEGYYSESHPTVVRKELCLEAMRLTYMLINNPATALPNVFALLALMCFHSSRLEARKDGQGFLILYGHQDTTLWDTELIARGSYFLHRATGGEIISKYHIEASIAYWHTVKTDTLAKWENILELHNHLLAQEYSPIGALNRSFALSKVKGKAAAIPIAEELNLVNNRYYYTLLGELYAEIDPAKARYYYEKGYALARTIADRQVLQQALKKLAG